jgi:hypothetical protein
MSEIIGADSVYLRRAAFEPFVRYLLESQVRLMQGAGEPKHVDPRSYLDKAVNETLPPAWNTVTNFSDGLIKLPEGDAGRVHDLGLLIEAADAASADLADHAFAPFHGPHV